MIEFVYRLSPGRSSGRKSGAGFPAGTYSTPAAASSANVVQNAPPVAGTPGALCHVSRAGPLSGTVSKRHTVGPSFSSSAQTWPVTPKLSPPALPTNTRPFHATGAIGTVTPGCDGDSSMSHAV